MTQRAAHSFGSKRPTTSNTQDSRIDPRTLETIKMLGNQVLEMREMIDKQTAAIKSLRQEVAALKGSQAEILGDIRLFQIDQKDIASQVRTIKAGRGVADPISANQEDIYRRFYNGYDESKVLRREEPVNREVDFVFGRIPRLLTLD
jgi:hypothetical protein